MGNLKCKNLLNSGHTWIYIPKSPALSIWKVGWSLSRYWSVFSENLCKKTNLKLSSWNLQRHLQVSMWKFTHFNLWSKFWFCIKFLGYVKCLYPSLKWQDKLETIIHCSGIVFRCIKQTNSISPIVTSNSACRKSSGPSGPCGLFNTSSLSVLTPRKARSWNEKWIYM